MLTISVIMLLAACGNEHASTPSRFDIYKAMQHNYRQGSYQPLSGHQLQKYLPPHLVGYLKTESNGQTFQSPFVMFSEAERIYHGRQRLGITLSDYVRDSTSFLKLWDQYATRRVKHPQNTFYHQDISSFGWIQEDSTRAVISLHAALKNRFWLEIRLGNLQLDVSHPENHRELEKVYRLIVEGMRDERDEL